MNQEYSEQTHEGYFPQECNAFGFHEVSGREV